MTADDWEAEKTFAKKLVKSIGISPTGGHAAVALFSTTAQLEIKFSDHKTFESFEVAVDNLLKTDQTTRIDRGLGVALDTMFTAGNGMRPTSTKSVVLITDGANDVEMDSSSLKNRFRAKNIKLIVVGAGEVNKAELEKLVEYPKDLHIAADMDALNMGEYFRNVEEALCKGK